MQSYIDVSMTLIFMGAALLLLLVLISFLLLSRRASQQERRLDGYQNLLEELSTENKKLQELLSLQDKRLQTLEISNSALNEHIQKVGIQEQSYRQEFAQEFKQEFTQEITQKYEPKFANLAQEYQAQIKSLSDKIKSLEEQCQTAKIAQSSKAVSQISTVEQGVHNTSSINQVANANAGQSVVQTAVQTSVQPTVQTNASHLAPLSNLASEGNSEDEARKLIKGGMDLNEVASRTGLSSVEIDMIANMLAPSSSEDDSLPPPVGNVQHHEIHGANELGTDDTSAYLEQKLSPSGEEQNQNTALEKHMRAPHHIASLKARNAYGMSLRRQR